MADRLAEARRRLHGDLRAQALERAGRTIGTHVPAPKLPAGTYDGNYAALGLRSSDPHAAAQLWESRHPGAMRSGNIPNWVTQDMLPGGHVGSEPADISHPFRAPTGGAVPAPNPGGGLQHIPEHFPGAPFGGAGRPVGFPRGGVMEGGFPPSSGLIHLGGGIFLHPETGQLHGFGNPLQNALHSVSAPAPAPAPAAPAPVAF